MAVPVLLLAGACAEVGAPPGDSAPPGERELHVAPDGDDGNPGSEQEPFGSLGHALAELRAGDTLTVHDGEYVERVTDVRMPDGDTDAPTVVQAEEGAQPLVRGLLWLEGGSHWTVDGIAVTWDPDTGSDDEHMVKVTDGTDWVLTNADIGGAASFAGLLVAGSGGGEPARWEVSHSCIHDTVPTNGTNQDHNVYVNTGLDAGPGLLEGNLLFGAPNGENLKLGPPGDSGGTADVTVRNNTLHGAVQNVLLSGQSRDNVVEGNILGGTGDNAAVRGFELTGADNVVRDNVAFDAAGLLDEGDGGGIVDGGGNRFPLDPGFDRTDDCDGFAPGDDDVEGRGHRAAAP
jgi:hypothetical protein